MTGPQPEGGDRPAARPVALGTNVSRLSYAVERGLGGEVADLGLSTMEGFFLHTFLAWGEECSATQLADMLPVDPARISRVVTKLVDMGFLRRRRLRDDRRVVMLRLTDRGTEVATEITQRSIDFNAKVTEGVTDADLRTFESVVDRIVANYADLRKGG